MRMISLDLSMRVPKIFKHGLPTSACLIERVADRLNYFQAVVKGKGLVSSSYSSPSAAEFTTAVTDRLREQERAQVLRRFSVQNEQQLKCCWIYNSDNRQTS